MDGTYCVSNRVETRDVPLPTAKQKRDVTTELDKQ
eukprot:SAG11_NODE_9456_length_910_cov_0.933416_1_plen_35_part_10